MCPAVAQALRATTFNDLKRWSSLRARKGSETMKSIVALLCLTALSVQGCSTETEETSAASSPLGLEAEQFNCIGDRLTENQSLFKGQALCTTGSDGSLIVARLLDGHEYHRFRTLLIVHRPIPRAGTYNGFHPWELTGKCPGSPYNLCDLHSVGVSVAGTVNQLVLQGPGAGNLVAIGDGKARSSTNSYNWPNGSPQPGLSGGEGTQLVLQPDSNLVLYGADGRVIWTIGYPLDLY
jgi:hypothetical protein